MTLRGVLKHETEGLHTRLDAALSALDLADPSDYGLFLRVHAAALPPVERELERAGIGALMDDWPRRVRRPALDGDLAALGLVPPAPIAFAPLLGADEMLGALYVLEGSRLGHAVLLRHLPEDAPTRRATGFLAHGSGERLWGAFLAALAGREGTGADEARMVGAARRTFAAYLAAVGDVLPTVPASLSATPPPAPRMDLVS